jgi:hypothetical protein
LKLLSSGSNTHCSADTPLPTDPASPPLPPTHSS